MIAVVLTLGMGVYVFGAPAPEGHLDSVTAAQRAFQQAQNDVDQVFGPGIDLVRDDQAKATRLLTDAYQQLQLAGQSGVPSGTIAPLMVQVVAGLDRIYKVVTVSSSLLFSFEKSVPKADIKAVVQGPDGAPYVMDRVTKTVYRIDLKTKKATPIIKNGTVASGIKAAEPKMLSANASELLVLDAKNVLWRWRPADTKGKGTLSRVQVNGSSGWGTDIRAIGTFVRNANEGLYNLYVVDPSERQILRYSPAADGSGFPAAPTAFLATAADGRRRERDVHRRRHLRGRGRPPHAIPGPRRQLDRLGGDRTWRHAASGGAELRQRSRPPTGARPACSTHTTGRTAGSSPSTRPVAHTSSSSGRS